MIKKLLCVIALIVSAITTMANDTKTVKLTFSKQQFSFVKNSAGATEIIMRDGVFGYGEDTSLPGLPLVAVNVRVPNGVDFDGLTEAATKKILFNDVVVATNPVNYPTNYVGEMPQATLPNYSATSYPSSNVQYVSTSTADGYTVLRFLVCPFKYDTQEKRLYLTNSISFNISLKDSPSLQSDADNAYGQNLAGIMSTQVMNASEFEEPALEANAIDLKPGVFRIPQSGYIIITSEALASHFKPLASWKKQKGLNSKIVTIEEIKKLYPDIDTQLAIKTYLKEQYDTQKLRYVLLGGDDTVVPVKYCYYREEEKGGTSVITYTPSDLFYACFEGNMAWDGNGNGISGELADKVDFTPSIFITRAPVRTISNVETFVNRILGYEKEPTKNQNTLLDNVWGNNILMAGDSITPKWPSTTQSDTDYKSRVLYNKYIAPYWNGTKKMFYDTSTDFPGGADYALSTENFQNELSKGYTFVDYMAHGSVTAWHLEDNWFYNVEEAEQLENSGYSIIVTGSCLTNAFDEMVDWKGDINDPCLSEAFIRNPKSGIVAYYGCSREGWSSWSPSNIGPSLQYEAEFYKKLFSPTPINKNFGEIVAASKLERVALCGYDGSNRYLQLGLNPIGDPEMPVYTTTPKQFANVMTTYSKDGKSVAINTGVDSCKICIMSANDDGESYYSVLNNVKETTLSVDQIYSVCITKQNYIPRTLTLLPRIPSISRISKCSVAQGGNVATISTQLSDDIKGAMIVVSSASGVNQKEYEVSADDPTVSADISNNPNGVQTVSLFVDGKKVDSSSFMK